MAKNDFLLNIGFKIDTKSIQKGVLRNALNKAAEGLTLKISKVKLSNPQQMRKQIAQQLGSVQLGALSVSSNAAKSLARSIQDKTKPTIKSLTVSPSSLSNLRKSVERALSNVQVSVAGIQGGGRPSSRSQQPAGAGGRGAGSVSRNTRDLNVNTQAIEERKKQLLKMAEIERRAFAQMTNSQRAIVRSAQAFKQSGFNADELGVKIGQVTKRFAEYAVSVKLIQGLQGAFNLGLQGLTEFDSAVQDLAKVSTAAKDIGQGFSVLSTVALSTGKSIQDVSDAVGEFVRQGKSLQDAQKAAQQALQLSNVSLLNGADAARVVTAAQQVFGSTSEELGAQLSSLAVFADSSATNVTEIGQAFLRAASSAKVGGFTLEETFAVLASTLEQTRLQSATVGTALKTIVARLGRDRNKVAALANSFLGLSEGQEGFVDSSGSVRDILNQLGQNFNKLTLAQKQQLALSVAGVRQGNVFIGMLDNFAKSQELANNAQADSSAINEKNQKQLQKLETRYANLVTSVKAFGAALGGVDSGQQTGVGRVLGTTIDLATDTVQALTTVKEEMGAVGDILATGGLGAAAGAIRNVIAVALKSFARFSNLGNQFVETNKAATQAQQELTKAISQTNEELRESVQLSQQAQGAPGRPRRREGVRGGPPGGTPTGFGKSAKEFGGNFLLGAATAGTQRNLSRDDRGTQIARGAGAGFATFAVLESFNQGLDVVKENLGKNADQFKRLAEQTADLTEQQRLLNLAKKEEQKASLVDIATQGATTAAMAKLLGATLKGSLFIGVFVSALQFGADRLKRFLADIDQAQRFNARRFANDQFDSFSREMASLTVESIKSSEALKREVDVRTRAISATRDFAKALEDAAAVEQDVITGLQADLSGTDPRIAKLDASIDRLTAKLSEASFRDIEGNVLSARQAEEIQRSGGFVQGQGSFQTEAALREIELKKIESDRVDAERFKEPREVLEIQKELVKQINDLENINQTKARDAIENVRASVIEAVSDKGVGKAFADSAITALKEGTGFSAGTAGILGIDTGVEVGKDATASQFIGGTKESLANSERLFQKELDKRQRASEELNESIDNLRKQNKKEADEAQRLLIERAGLEKQRAEFNKLTNEYLKLQADIQQKKNQEELRGLQVAEQVRQLNEKGLEGKKKAIALEERERALNSSILKAAQERSKTAGRDPETDPAVQRVKDAALQGAANRTRFRIAALEREESEKKLKELTDNIRKAEDKRNEALSKLQANQKSVLDNEKKVSQANQGLANAFLEVASAQKRLNDAVSDQREQIRSSVRNALSGVGFETLINIGGGLSEIVSQEQKLALIRKEGLEQSLKIAQQQAGTLFSIGERLATGGPGARLDLQRSLSVAQAIQGGASVQQFSPDDIKLALQNAELFPGLKEEITRQSLATVGLEDELSQLKSSIASGTAEQTRERTDESVKNAQAQLAAALRQVDEAEQIKRIAEDDLALAKDQVASSNASLDIARAQVTVQHSILNATNRQNETMNKLSNYLAGGPGAAGTTGRIGNAARGSLSSAEMSGLYAAAKREKALMPAGSRLMLANTSETVLTAKQSKRLGIGSKSQSNAANGNGDFSSVVNLLSGLLSEMRALRSKVDSTGVNNVNLQVDTNKNVNVKGIEGLSQRLQNELQGKFASGSDINAVESAIFDILDRLGENGLSDGLGR